MKISVSATLNIDIDGAWEMLHTPTVFRAVSAPFTVFREDPSAPLPHRFQPATDYPVIVSAGGVIPMGRQIIRLTDFVESWRVRRTVDGGRGESGLLAQFRNWHHQMALEALPNGNTLFRDQLTVNASWLTPLMWLGFGVFWRWRALRLRSIAKRLSSPTQRAWDQRYLSRSAMWSGQVNPHVASIAHTLTPGTVLDVGAGEGGDAIWLAEAGWTVHAVDASAVAVFRGQKEADRRSAASGKPLAVTWRVADVAADLSSDATFDFVSLQFLHLEPKVREKVWQRALAAVAPGGTFLIVGHSVGDAQAGVPRPPDDLLFSRHVFTDLRPEGWSDWRVFEQVRPVELNDTMVDVTDVVLVGRR